MINRFAKVNATRILIVGGIVLMLSFLLDVLVLIFPFQPTNERWQIALVTALVDRGIVPMVGLGMLFTGYWISSIDDRDRDSASADNSVQKPIFDLRFPSLILATILGLIFLMFFPLHLNNVRQISTQRVEKINQKAEELEKGLKDELSREENKWSSEQGKAQIQQIRTKTKNELSAILKNEATFKKAIDSPQVPAPVKEVLKKAKENPQQLEKLIAEQTNPIEAIQKQADKRLNKIRSDKEAAEKLARQEALQRGLRTGLSSLLLSVGYTIIGWSGLRSMNSSSGKKRKPAIR